VKVKDSAEFERVAAIKPFRLYEEELAANPAKYVTKFSGLGDGRRLEKAGCLDGAHAVWSLWTGYLDDPSGIALRKFLAERNVPLTVHHTSGHASVKDLQRLATALAPKRIVPIHSLAGHKYSDYLDAVDPQSDGAWWEV
jgi:ribonuclease J